MAWQQLLFNCPQSEAETLAEWLTDQGAMAVTFQDAEDQPILEPAPGEVPLWDDIELCALFQGDFPIEGVNSALEHHPLKQRLHSMRWQELDDQVWERAWMNDFQPMSFGERLWICPSWCEPPVTDAINIVLDPGLAFGTGTHETTALCLHWLDSALVEDQQVIDFGCGSGILGVAALKLGAAKVIGVDIDDQALEASRANAVINDINADRLELAKPDAIELKPCDLLIANILAGPLRELAPTFAELVFPGGDLLLSGILTEQTKSIIEAYEDWFTFSVPMQRGDWVCLHAKRL